MVEDLVDWSRQRCEQYFTLSQSRAHFLRHAKGRAQVRQSFVGRSALRRILAMASPKNGLAAPVIKTAIGLGPQALQHIQQMAGGDIGRMYF